MNGTNSGIQYRSVELPDIGKWVLKGYQADMDFTEGYVGNVHDERGRVPTGEGHVVLSKRGQVTRIVDGPSYKVVGDDRRQHAASRRHERQRLESVSHHCARPGAHAAHQRPADGRRDRRGRQARRALKACSGSRCTWARPSRSSTATSSTGSCSRLPKSSPHRSRQLLQPDVPGEQLARRFDFEAEDPVLWTFDASSSTRIEMTWPFRMCVIWLPIAMMWSSFHSFGL